MRLPLGRFGCGRNGLTIGFEQLYLRPIHISSVPTFSANIVAL